MPQTRRHPPTWSFAQLLPLACGASLVIGCAGDNRSTYDPLIGGTPAGQRAPMAPPPVPTPVAAASSSSAALPPLPVARSSTSPAALAGGTGQSLDGSHDPLRIGDPQPGGGAWKGSQTGVVLNRPEPAVDAAPRSNLPPLPGPPPTIPGYALTAGARTMTYEQGQALLSARGVKVQRLESTGENNEWRFTCAVPNRQNPQISRTYEARAADPVAAVRAMLDQLDKEQR
jgi:hypothetical protein